MRATDAIKNIYKLMWTVWTTVGPERSFAVVLPIHTELL